MLSNSRLYSDQSGSPKIIIIAPMLKNFANIDHLGKIISLCVILQINKMRLISKIFLLCSLSYHSWAQNGSQILQHLKDNQTIVAYEMLSANVQSKMTSDQLSLIWQGIKTQLGSFQSSALVEHRPHKDTLIFERLLCRFDKGEILFDCYSGKNAKKVEGLFFRPLEYRLPTYADTALFREKVMIFHRGQEVHRGVLTWPNKQASAPMAILIPGSGPVDADVTVGSNKIFKDIAYGLAANGVASVRFDKATFTNNNFKPTTLEDEYQADINFYIKKFSLSDSVVSISLVGHSLGTLAAIQAAAKHGKINALILMATPYQSTLDLIIAQSQYLKSLNPTLAATYDELIASAKNAKSDAPLDTLNLPMGLSKRYWSSLDADTFISTLSKLKQRTLFLQGDRDYQVPLADYERWKSRFGKRKNVQFRNWPDLNHLFLPGSGASSPTEYLNAGHVPIEVIKSISEFIVSK
jgi:pimeloyl-ACP methyl ester carboxylesterase